MAYGTVISVNREGGGTIAPDSNGEAIYYTSDSVRGLLEVNDRVQFLVQLTVHGVYAHTVIPTTR